MEVKQPDRNFILKQKLISRMELVKTVVYGRINFVKSVMKKCVLNCYLHIPVLLVYL